MIEDVGRECKKNFFRALGISDRLKTVGFTLLAKKSPRNTLNLSSSSSHDDQNEIFTLISTNGTVVIIDGNIYLPFLLDSIFAFCFFLCKLLLLLSSIFSDAVESYKM